MSSVPSGSTRPELKLRHELWRKGYRYRVNDKRLPGSPDIVLPKYKTVIFVHGCFWHGHKGCRYYRVPKSNTEFWIAKISVNRKRDDENWRQLEALGWYVIIVWECELRNNRFGETISHIEKQVQANGAEYERYRQLRIANNKAYSGTKL